MPLPTGRTGVSPSGRPPEAHGKFPLPPRFERRPLRPPLPSPAGTLAAAKNLPWSGSPVPGGSSRCFGGRRNTSRRGTQPHPGRYIRAGSLAHTVARTWRSLRRRSCVPAMNRNRLRSRVGGKGPGGKLGGRSPPPAPSRAAGKPDEKLSAHRAGEAKNLDQIGDVRYHIWWQGE